MKKLITTVLVVLLGFGALLADDYKSITSGRAAVTCTDGRQTVIFSNGASYTGNFENCRPVSGYGTYEYQEQVYSGYFTASGDSVVLEQDDYRIELKVTTSTEFE